jgi:hypothetical protein
MARSYKSEKDVKKTVKELLNRNGWFWWMPPANGFGKVGVADFNALKDGVFLAVETKFGNNQPTVQQKAYLQSIHAAGGLAFVVSEKTLEWFDVWLQTFDRSVEAARKSKPPTEEDGATMVNAVDAMTKDMV